MTSPQGIQKSVLATLAYSNHFKFPLTFSELHHRLINIQVEPGLLRKALQKLQAKKKVERKGPYYFLPGKSNIVKQRLIYSRLSKPLRSYAQSIVKNLTIFPTVKAIYLTGSLAMNNTDGHDDVDLMIVAKPGRLWTTRFILTIYTTLLGLRRTPHTKNIMGKLCLNLYLTPKSFALPPSRRSLYAAYELIQAKPIYDPHNTRTALLSANPWIHDYLPNFPLPSPTGSDPEGSAQPRPHHKRGGSDPIGTFIESIFFHLQYLYMKNKITREYITKDAAFFHPHDPAPKV